MFRCVYGRGGRAGSDKVHFDLHLDELYVKGYLEGGKGRADSGGSSQSSLGGKADDPGVRNAFSGRLSSGRCIIEDGLSGSTGAGANAEFACVKEMEEQFKMDV